MNYKPPFTLTAEILNKSNAVQYQLGKLTGAKLTPLPVKLRRQNTIKTIQASLAIEGNNLSTEQVTAILDGKPVMGSRKDILEVKNAIQVYDNLAQYDPLSETSLLAAHKVLMHNLVEDNGQWRQGNVGIFKGQEVAHVAPPASKVPSLMQDLFAFIKAEKDLPYLIKACIFHYELEFIHPFSDGNGRMGRLWQQLLLMKEHLVFEFIVIEELIKQTQHTYYDVLGECDQAGQSTRFIDYSLEQILKALEQFNNQTVSSVKDAEARLNFAFTHFGNQWFSRKNYMLLHKDISPATASRDLIEAVQQGILIKEGKKNQTRYRFKRDIYI